MTRAKRHGSVRQTCGGLFSLAALALLVGCVGQLSARQTQAKPAQDARVKSADAPSEPIYLGVIADAAGTMDFKYVIVPEAVNAEVSVLSQTESPPLQARGPVIVYVEGKAGRVYAEHVNTYVSGRGGDGKERFGLIRRAASDSYSVYHLPPIDTPHDADVVTVTIFGDTPRMLAEGQYIDVVLQNGAWKFSNHQGGDQAVAYADVRDQGDASDVGRIEKLRPKAAGL